MQLVILDLSVVVLMVVPGEAGVPQLLGLDLPGHPGQGTPQPPGDLIAQELSIDRVNLWRLP